MVAKIIVGILAGIVTAIIWGIVGGIAGAQKGGADVSILFLSVFSLSLTLAIFAQDIRRGIGWSVLLIMGACFYAPIASLIFSTKYVATSTTGTDAAAGVIGGTLLTGFVSFVGFFLGIILAVLSYFLLRSSPDDRTKINEAWALSVSGKRTKTILICLFTVLMLVSLFRHIFEYPRQQNEAVKVSAANPPSEQISKANPATRSDNSRKDVKFPGTYMFASKGWEMGVVIDDEDKKNPGHFYVDMELVAGNGCVGQTEGIATLAALNTLSMKKNKDGNKCEVQFSINKEGDLVVEESDCSSSHGVRCSFVGVLNKVK